MSCVFTANKNLFLWGLDVFLDSTVSMATEVYLLPIGIEKHRSCLYVWPLETIITRLGEQESLREIEAACEVARILISPGVVIRKTKKKTYNC